jgi:ubiquitin thioesterase otulin
MDKDGRLSHLLSVFNFKPFDFEFRLLEAVKFLMLHQAIQLHREMKACRDVPVFAMIMFARDTSEDPWHFMMKHLNYVGDTGGLEQVRERILKECLAGTEGKL